MHDPHDQPNPHRPLASVRRHSLVVRITHWCNVLCMTVLLMSGLQIFNATPALYWGDASDFSHPLVAMGSERRPDGSLAGVTEVFGHRLTTTGILGLSTGPDGQVLQRAFPTWATLPGPQWLAMGRRWHLFFAWLFVLNGAVYLASGLLSGHFRRDLLPSAWQFRHIGHTIGEHLRLRFPRGEAARHYNVLQKLTYLVVVFALLPLIVLAGLAMSPGLDSAFPLLPALFGGRQAARTIHFLIAWTLVAFVIVHVLMVILAGPINHLRAMITGRYNLEEESDQSHAPH